MLIQMFETDFFFEEILCANLIYFSSKIYTDIGNNIKRIETTLIENHFEIFSNDEYLNLLNCCQWEGEKGMWFSPFFAFLRYGNLIGQLKKKTFLKKIITEKRNCIHIQAL